MLKMNFCRLVLIITVFLTFDAMAGKQGPLLKLKKSEGKITLSAMSGESIRVAINEKIGTGKVVVASLDGEQLPDTNKFIIQLFDASGNRMVAEAFGRRYKKSRMTYFITSGEPKNYYLQITPTQPVPEFDLNVKVVERMGPFSRLDSKEQPSDLFTYFMSNSPENLENEAGCLGENGWYLARGKIQGNANIYWEHCNYLGYDAKFGVLLWNKEDKPVTVKLNSTSAKSWTDAGSMEPAMCGVWLDWLKGKLNDNDLPDDFRKSFELPAYSPENPSASARWILIQTVETNNPVSNTFNGLINVSLTNADGSLFSGDHLFCDTYIMKKGDEARVLSHVATNDIVPVAKALRGSGSGAMLETSVAPVEITPEKPFCFLMTGHDPPHFQDGENIVTYYYNKDGSIGQLPTAFGYAVVYKYNFSGFRSDRPVKARFKFNPYTNPNALMDPWSGMYVIGKCQRTGAIFSKQVLIGQEYVFDENVPLDQTQTYYLIISGMSSLPLEVEFYNE